VARAGPRRIAKYGERFKARYYFSRLLEMADTGGRRPETEQARRFLTSN
jgi:hypothetical protein